MKQSKLSKKLRELPIEERELLLKQELNIIEVKKATDQAIRATIEFRKMFRPVYEDFQGENIPISEILNDYKSKESEYELKKELDIELLTRKYEAQVEKNKALEEKIKVLEKSQSFLDLPFRNIIDKLQ